MGRRAKKTFRYLVPTLIALVAGPVVTQLSITRPTMPEELDCAICLKGHKSRVMNLPTGFTYELIRDFAGHFRSEAEIVLGEASESLAMLALDSLDIVVMPYSDTLTRERGYIVSDSLENGTVWVMRATDDVLMCNFTHWFNLYSQEEGYDALKRRFRPSYEPYRRVALGREYAAASPYDALLKQYATQAGWDWRMLAALVWQESRFRIDARSSKGAEGLLQMMPATARRFKNDDMLDPEKNLAAGTAYIRRLNSIFTQFVSDADDLPKFVMAAYSAGEGRVLDCIRYARAKGLPHSSWEDLENIIGDLRENGPGDADTLLQYGGLRGYETLNYVSNIYSLYDAFTLISP